MKADEARQEADIRHHRRMYGAIREAAADGRYRAQIANVPQRVAADIAADLRDDGYSASMTEPTDRDAFGQGGVVDLAATW